MNQQQTRHPVWERIRELGLKQNFVGEKLGVSPWKMTRIVHGVDLPDRAERMRLARFLKTTESALWPELFTNR